MPESDPDPSVLERFLRYVRFDTQSSETSETYPSTAKQLVLLEHLVGELRAIGLADAAMDEHGYVTATVPATSAKRDVPVIGFIAHVDTSPEMPGENVVPIVHRDYQGQDLVLPDDPTAVLRFAENPHLAEQIGNDIVTASGTTLLGADNKAGVAEIVAAAEYLMAHPEIPHGTVRLAFTPDEEVGNGTQHFDVAKFGAACAYTVDGEALGEVEMESFSADSLTLTFQGFNTHPGYGKGRMINSIKVASDFVSRLPKDRTSPETTEGYEDYVHPYVVNASVERTSVKLLIRDFRTAGLQEKEALARGAGAGDRRRLAGLVGDGQGGRVLPQHAGDPRRPPPGGGERPRSDPPRRPRRARAPDPRRHRRLAPLLHGPADPQPLRRRAQLPLPARVGLGPGHGEGGRGDRRALPRLRRAGGRLSPPLQS